MAKFITTRLTNTGNLVVSGSFDETTQSTISTKGNIVYAALLDEVTFSSINPVIKNINTYTQQFTDSSWSKTRASVSATSATLAPDGTSTVYKLISDASASTTHYCFQGGKTVTAGLNYTFSIYAKAAEYTGAYLQFYNTNGAFTTTSATFDLIAGTVTGTSGPVVNSGISYVGNGWYRIFLTTTALITVSGANVTFQLATTGAVGTQTFTGDGTSGTYFWGAQYEQSSAPTIYQGIAAANTLVTPTFAKKEDSTGAVYVTNNFDEVTGMLVTSGLIAYIDAAKSFQGNGVTTGNTVPIFDLVANNKASMSGTVNWVNKGTASYWNFPTASGTNYIISTLPQNYLDFTIVFQPDFTLTSDASLVGLIGTSPDSVNSDKSLRFLGANGTGPWTLRNPDNTDGWASTATTFYLNGVASTTDGAALASGWNVLGGKRTNTTNGAFASNFAYVLGTEGYSTVRDFRGNIAAVAFYNRQLTAAEQLNNYNYFAARYGLPTSGI